MGSSKYYILPSILLLLIGTLLGIKLEGVLSGTDTLSHLKKLENAFLIINEQYVDDRDPQQSAEEAIEGMLQRLDPHSTYISAEELKEIQEGYQGSFGGIGIMFEKMEGDTAHVISTIAGGPSEETGVLAGDRIIAIDGEDAVDLSVNKVVQRLKGPIGTPVEVTVLRPGTRTPLRFEIRRGRIPIYTVESAYLLDDGTGYVKVSRFAMTTHREFMEKVRTLREQGMERLVLDLRDNPGGVMSAAVDIADEMLGSGKTIVYTKGRAPRTTEVHHSTRRGELEDLPVIVLVSPFSASASEIVAGALQDHDRALIVGQRTFGKGLVQQQFPLTDGSVLQMTVSRYYTPLGRLIQTPYEDGDRETYYEEKFSSLEDASYHVEDYIERMPDSLAYETERGRTVFGGGGILPDYVIAPDTTSALHTYLRSRILSEFVRDYFVRHEQELRAEWQDREQEFVRTFLVSEPAWQAFLHYVREEAGALGDEPAARAAFSQTRLAEHRSELETLLKAYLGRQLYSTRAWYPIFNSVDPEFAQVRTLWDRAERLASY